VADFKEESFAGERDALVLLVSAMGRDFGKRPSAPRTVQLRFHKYRLATRSNCFKMQLGVTE